MREDNNVSSKLSLYVRQKNRKLHKTSPPLLRSHDANLQTVLH
ncbi:hypothetical protein CKA32_001823 [Geitlerinema sp. FC II]|nr:hypothetical protein CKA32_001823 [Geitlerinema sp. FC II]